MQKSFMGKYRGTVVDNVDPKQLGRLKISVPAVLGKTNQSWAMPCVPYAGPNVGWFFIPPKNANIWVEFEGGDPDYPIWTGCFWDKGKLPESASAVAKKVLKTEAINLVLDDTDNQGGFLLEVGKPAVSKPLSLKFDKDGISLVNENATVNLTADGIELKYNNVHIKLASGNLEIKQNQQEIKLAASGIDITATKLDMK
jgi:hypothetical protein